MAASILAGMTILMIGDSHLATPDYLIATLHNDLVAQGANVHTLGVCGANAGDWLKAPPPCCTCASRACKASTCLSMASRLSPNSAERGLIVVCKMDMPAFLSEFR